ncbi:MAG: DMT family transporter [Bacteroidales bacterium]
MKGSKFSTVLLLLLLAMIWGSSFILIKKGLIYMSASQLGALRVAISSVALSPFVIRKLKKYNAQEKFYLLVSGFCGSVGPAFLFAFAETKIDSSVAGVLNSLTPIFTLIIGFSFFQLSITKQKLSGVFLGFSGAIFLILSQSEEGISLENIEYSVLPIIATILYGVNINLVKKKLSHIPSFQITAISFLLWMPVVVGYLAFSGYFVDLLYTPGTINGFMYVSILSLVGTAMAYIIFNRLIKMSGPIFASSVTYLIPVFAILWGIFDGETIELRSFMWSGLILAGIFLINAPSTKGILARTTK